MNSSPHPPTEFFCNLVRETKEEADRIIQIVLPRKICNLSEFIEEMQQTVLQNEELPDVDMRGESVDCNEKINALNAKLKKEIAEFLDIYDVLYMWITYNRAPADNGHPLGEEVQNELFNSLDAGKDSAVEMLVSLSSYFQDRSNNILVCRRNMEVSDLVQYIRTLDNAHFFTLCQGFRDLRNAYSTILDKINKNYDKIVKPKGTSHLQHDLMY